MTRGSFHHAYCLSKCKTVLQTLWPVLSNVAFLTFNFLALKFTGFGLEFGLWLKHRICKKATLDKKVTLCNWPLPTHTGHTNYIHFSPRSLRSHDRIAHPFRSLASSAVTRKSYSNKTIQGIITNDELTIASASQNRATIGGR